MYSIITSSAGKINISAETYSKILEAGKRGDRAFLLEDTGESISLRPFPNILLTERVEQKEQEVLEMKGKFRCKHGVIHEISVGCHCTFYKKEKIGVFEISPEIKRILKIGIKSMSEPSYEEKLISRAESGEPRARNILNGKQ